MSRYVRRRIVALTAERLDGAELQADTILYAPPFGVVARGVRLIGRETAGGTPIEVLSVARIDLKLARLPAHDQPLMIERLRLAHPTVRFIRRHHRIVSPDQVIRPTTAPTPRARKKFSEILRLNDLAIDGGEAVVVAGGASADPIESRWGGIHLDVRSSPSAYIFRIASEGDKPGGFAIAARGTIDPDTGEGLLENLSIASVQPPTCPRPLEQITGGSIRLVGGVAKIENLRARYGDDMIALSSARASFNKASDEIALDEIAGTITFAPPPSETPYPPKLQKTLEQLHPAGTYTVGGRVTVGRHPGDDGKRPLDYQLMISADDAALAVTNRRLPITHVRGDGTLSKSEFVLKRIAGETFGGRVTAQGKIVMTRPFRYEGAGTAQDVDVDALAQALFPPPKRTFDLSGKGSIDARIAGRGPGGPRAPLDTFEASGTFDVSDGNLWQVPILKGIVAHSKVAKELLTAGEAAGVFDIADRAVGLKRAAVNAPALGIEGSGTIGFDGDVDLRIVAAPLADWREKMRETNVPVLSDAVGDFLGGVQRLINTATKTLIYHFEAKGKLPDPKVIPVPAPVLTRSTAALFGKMLNPTDKRERLIDLLAPPTTQAAPPPSH